jgi:hypothetical protein
MLLRKLVGARFEPITGGAWTKPTMRPKSIVAAGGGRASGKEGNETIGVIVGVGRCCRAGACGGQIAIVVIRIGGGDDVLVGRSRLGTLKRAPNCVK